MMMEMMMTTKTKSVVELSMGTSVSAALPQLPRALASAAVPMLAVMLVWVTTLRWIQPKEASAAIGSLPSTSSTLSRRLSIRSSMSAASSGGIDCCCAAGCLVRIPAPSARHVRASSLTLLRSCAVMGFEDRSLARVREAEAACESVVHRDALQRVMRRLRREAM
jgi:hypothetical protein